MLTRPATLGSLQTLLEQVNIYGQLTHGCDPRPEHGSASNTRVRSPAHSSRSTSGYHQGRPFEQARGAIDRTDFHMSHARRSAGVALRWRSINYDPG
jgi:hypothetical protein